MPNEPYRVLFVASHPVQYAAPIFRKMAQHPKLDMQVAYCSLQGAEGGTDPEFGVEVKWDVPLLDGYPWVQVPNRSWRPRLGRFFGLMNPGLWRMVRSGGFDAVVIYTGYACFTFWITLIAVKIYGTAILFGTDAHGLRPRDGKRWKAFAKKLLWPKIFGLANVVIVPSSRSHGMMRDLGIESGRLALTPYVVDNDWWVEQASRVDRTAVRNSWDIPDDASVVLFCAKLQAWKRPLDLLHAFAQANVTNSYLVYAGEGPLRMEAEAIASSLGMKDRVRFIGFVNQAQLPAVYRAADLMVLPSEYEPFGVVVNEAMLCGCASAVSDRVGAGSDLIETGKNGYVFPCRDVDALATILRTVLADRDSLSEISRAASERMETWSPQENIEALIGAIKKATHPQQRNLHPETPDLQPRLRA